MFAVVNRMDVHIARLSPVLPSDYCSTVKTDIEPHLTGRLPALTGKATGGFQQVN